jgi:putative hydrolase of the HAD superfamily
VTEAWPDRYLVWDFDGTLATGEGHWPGALCAVIRRARPDLGITPDDIRPHIQTGFPWHAPEVVRPACSADEWWAALSPLFVRAYRACAALDEAEAVRLAEGVRTEYLAPQRWRLFDDVRPALTALRARGWRHLVLSNHVPELPRIMERLGLHELIEASFCSADIGAEKPHRSTFETVFARYPRARAGWMIGDSWRADVEGARAVGLRAILVRTSHAEAPLQCDTLHDVIPIVEAGGGSR